MQRLTERKIKYDDLRQQLDNTEEKQISATDADSRALIINKNIVEVSYNTQAAVDAKNNLLVHAEATNTNDGKAVHRAATQAKENMNLKKQNSIDVLSDKGTTPEQNSRCVRMITLKPMWLLKNSHQ